ncbi:hypothetical protein FOA20_24620 [Peribacillus simplex]
MPLDRWTGRLSFLPERFGCPTGWEVSRPALFYDSEGKGKNNKKSSRTAAILMTFYSFKLLTFGLRFVRYGGDSRKWIRNLQFVVIESFNAEATRTECQKGVLSFLYSL